MPAIDISECCIPAECDNIKLPYNGEIASRWDANLLCDICRHFASVMLHFASLHYTFSAYLPTHIKFLTEFHRIVFGTTCISFQKFSTNFLLSTEKGGRGWSPFWIGIGMLVLLLWCALEHWWATRTAWRWAAWTTTASTWRRSAWAWAVATVTPSVLLGGLIAL